MPGQVVSLSKETFQTMYNALQLRASYSPAIDSEFNKLTIYVRQTVRGFTYLLGHLADNHFVLDEISRVTYSNEYVREPGPNP